ncbi:MAG TPA: erythromycin esterase family protein [Chryseosolibacter sp.]
MNKILTILFTCCLTSAAGQHFLNLGFEYEITGTNRPQKWRMVESGYAITLDSSEHVSPGKSLRIQSENPSKGAYGVCSANFPLSMGKGKSIEFRARIKTENVTGGYAGLFWSVVNKDMSLTLDKMDGRGLTGSNGWTDVKISVAIDTAANHIEFGGLLSGQGTAWFDDFEIFIDGLRFVDGQPLTAGPTAGDLAWLKRHIHPLETYNPASPVSTDLDVLKGIVADAKVVALGEVTHGSSEIFQMKHRIIKYMAETCGFNTFSIEANMPEAYRVNDYVRYGEGNAADLLQGMYFWTWQTREVLDMVEWMRVYSEQGGEIQFTGFDMQFYSGALKELEAAFSNDKTVLSMLSSVKTSLGDEKVSQQLPAPKTDSLELEKQLNMVRHLVSESGKTEREKRWLLQNIRIISQYINYDGMTRDKFMAENLLWIKSSNRQAKIALWAHNFHIKKTELSMGRYLHDSLGADYLSIGFAFHDGFYTATGFKGLGSYKAQDPYVGTYEDVFNSLDEPIFLLDLRTMSETEEERTGWFFRNLEFRDVGAVKTDNEFSETNLKDDYDLIIFIKESSSSHLLH